MTRKLTINFRDGLVAKAQRSDFRTQARATAASELVNMVVTAKGGIKTRPGTVQINQVPLPPGNIQTLEHNIGPISMLVFQAEKLIICDSSGNQLAQLNSMPWSMSDAYAIRIYQFNDRLLFTHPSIQPIWLRLFRNQAPLQPNLGVAQINETENYVALHSFEFATGESGKILQPYIPISSIPGRVSFSRILGQAGKYQMTCQPLNQFRDIAQNTRILIAGEEFVVLQRQSNSELTVQATRQEMRTIVPAATLDWQVALYNQAFTYPAFATVFQNRLVFGGNTNYGNYLCLSSIKSILDFSLGAGNPDEAIIIELPTTEKILHCLVLNDLLLFGIEGIYQLAGSPIQPLDYSLQRISGIASSTQPPIRVGNRAVMLSRSNQELIQLQHDGLEQKFQLQQLNAKVSDLFIDRIKLAYDTLRQLLMICIVDQQILVLPFPAHGGANNRLFDNRQTQSWTNWQWRHAVPIDFSRTNNELRIIVSQNSTRQLLRLHDRYHLDFAEAHEGPSGLRRLRQRRKQNRNLAILLLGRINQQRVWARVRVAQLATNVTVIEQILAGRQPGENWSVVTGEIYAVRFRPLVPTNFANISASKANNRLISINFVLDQGYLLDFESGTGARWQMILGQWQHRAGISFLAERQGEITHRLLVRAAEPEIGTFSHDHGLPLELHEIQLITAN